MRARAVLLLNIGHNAIGFQGGKLSARLLGFVLSLIYLALVVQSTGQIAVVFDQTSFFQAAVALIAAFATGVVLSLFQATIIDPTRRQDDYVLFFAPAAFVAARLAGFGLTGIVAATGVAMSAAYVLYVIERRQITAPNYLKALVTAALITVALHVLLRVMSVALSREIGALNLVVFFMSLTTIVVICLIRLGIFGRIALIAGLACFIFYEPSHEIATEEASVNFQEPPSLQVAFVNWLLSRNDLDAYIEADQPYPVMLVSSEGGGGYAAAHANIFLRKTQASCPNFAQHTFALVGVSGGIVGNTLFHGSLRDTNLAAASGCSVDRQRPADFGVIQEDHLSPVIATLLFRDAPNKLLLGLLGGRDRSGILRESLTASPEGKKLASETLLGHYWEKDENSEGMRIKDGPAVVPVASDVSSGMRYVFAPFAIGNERPNSYKYEEGVRDLLILNGGKKDIRLIDAAIASASFPYVTPSLKLPLSSEITEPETNSDNGDNKSNTDDAFVTLVDGGYLDNSGVETLIDILGDLIDIRLNGDGMPPVSAQTSKSYKGSHPALKDCTDIDFRFVAPPQSVRETMMDNARVLEKGVKILADRVARAENSDTQAQNSYAILSEEGIFLDARNEACTIKFSVYSVIIRSETFPVRLAEGQSFLFDPVNALERGRQTRAEAARYNLLATMCGTPVCHFPQGEARWDWNYIESVIDPTFMAVPLGWYIPESGLQEIYRTVAAPDTEFPEISNAENEQRARHSSKFGHMQDNPVNMEALFSVLSIPKQEKPAEAAQALSSGSP